MAKITVKVRSDIERPGKHPVFGTLTPGMVVTLEEEQFGAALFERPSPEWLSPLEQADKLRGEELKQSVGTYIYVEPPPEAPAKNKRGAAPTDTTAQEVTPNA